MSLDNGKHTRQCGPSLLIKISSQKTHFQLTYCRARYLNIYKKTILPANATIFMISPTLTSCLIMRTCSWVSCSLSKDDLWGKKLFLRFLSHS